jgi:hypothetical protein
MVQNERPAVPGEAVGEGLSGLVHGNTAEASQMPTTGEGQGFMMKLLPFAGETRDPSALGAENRHPL